MKNEKLKKKKPYIYLCMLRNKYKLYIYIII